MQWKDGKLSAYLQDGSLHIDNNAFENALRPISWAGKITCSLALTMLQPERA